MLRSVGERIACQEIQPHELTQEGGACEKSMCKPAKELQADAKSLSLRLLILPGSLRSESATW